MPRSCLTAGVGLALLASERPRGFVERATKAVFLELRQKHLAMGRAVRCYSNFYLSNT